MTKNERIQYLSDEIEDLKARVRYLETKPAPFNPWTPIGPAPSTAPWAGYTCPSCGIYVTAGLGHSCNSNPWWNIIGSYAR